MANKFIQTNTIVEQGPLTTTVPLNRRLYVANTTLDANITLVPAVNLGTPEINRPVAGSKTIYKITGDGLHSVRFSSLFKNKVGSKMFNPTAGYINVIEFEYDGEDAWYTISADAARWEIINDYGYDPGSITLVGIASMAGVVDANDVLTVSVKEILTRIHYVGSLPLTYTIESGAQSVSDTDPESALLTWSGASLGANVVTITVTDGVLSSGIFAMTYTVIDGV
jgi:hypothetical protein